MVSSSEGIAFPIISTEESVAITRLRSENFSSPEEGGGGKGRAMRIGSVFLKDWAMCGAGPPPKEAASLLLPRRRGFERE